MSCHCDMDVSMFYKGIESSYESDKSIIGSELQSFHGKL